MFDISGGRVPSVIDETPIVCRQAHEKGSLVDDIKT